MAFTVEHIGNVVVITPETRLGEEFIPLNEVQKLIDAGERQFLVDLACVLRVDSIALGNLAEAFVASHKAGGLLYLCSVHKRIKKVLDVVKLSKILGVFDSRKEALQAFPNP